MYILRCVDGSFSVGSTGNVDARLDMHQSGEGADWTSKCLPVSLVFSEEFDSVFEAFQAERQVKGWSGDKKRALTIARLKRRGPSSGWRAWMLSI